MLNHLPTLLDIKEQLHPLWSELINKITSKDLTRIKTIISKKLLNFSLVYQRIHELTFQIAFQLILLGFLW